MAAAGAHNSADTEASAASEGDASSPEPFRSSGGSDGSSGEIIDMEMGKPEECRICQMNLAEGSSESGNPIELGCSCKGDLAAAHKNCAETWFRIRGNRTCEICGSVAKNVAAGEVAEDGNEASGHSPAAAAAAQQRGFCRENRLVNFLLGCMVFAFIVSWLFHFKGPG